MKYRIIPAKYYKSLLRNCYTCSFFNIVYSLKNGLPKFALQIERFK